MSPVATLRAAAALVGLSGCGQFIEGLEPGALGSVVVGSLPPDALVVDARSPEQVAAGHIPGAARVHWTELTGFDEDGLWALRDDEVLAALLGDRGLSRDTPLALVGGGPEGWGDDGNLYWTLRYLGHDDVVVLDGGYVGWLAAGGQPTTAQDGPGPTRFTPSPVPAIEATSAQVADWTGALLDVRSHAEWTEGHIPGAVWYPWDQVYAGDGTLRSAEALADDFAALGIDLDTPVAVYCEAGVRAGHTWMVLEALGVVEVRNYLGSFARWTAEGRPVEE